MRVLIVHPFLNFYGGAELVVVKLSNYLARLHIENSILTLAISDDVKKDLKRNSIILPDEPLKIKYTTPLALRSLLLKNMKKFDVINVHNFPADVATVGCKKPVVWMCNEPPEVFYTSSRLGWIIGKTITLIERYVVKNNITISCVADEFNSKRFKRLFGVKPVINYYGIDYDFFSKGSSKRGRKLLNIDKNVFMVLHVGTVSPLKNQMESVKTIEKLKNKIPNVKLVLAGKPYEGYQALIEKYMQEQNLKEDVIFTGHLPRTTIRDLYAACDVALFPIKSQGGWLSPFEALCAGKPIIVSKLITSSNIIKQHNLGIVTDDFASGIMDVYHSYKKYRNSSKKSGYWVKKNLSWDRFCERMVTLFEKAVS